MTRSLLVCALLAGSAVFAQPRPETPDFVSSPRRLWTAPELPDAPDAWIAKSLAWSNFILEKYKPTWPETPVRRAALIRLDDVLHIESAPAKPLIHAWFKERMEKALAEIERSQVTEGMRVWKLYNHGFFVRTASVSFAIDIVPGPPSNEPFRMDPAWLARVARQADAMFISHFHSDHANEETVDAFLAAGKVVVAPEGLWTNKPVSAKLLYPKRSADTVHEIALQTGKKLKVVAYPGHQSSPVTNNNHLVIAPEGYSVMQTGDQSTDAKTQGDWDWVAKVSHQHQVDVYLPNCWMDNLPRAIRGVNPALVITGHENEMAHTVPHREDFTQTYNRLEGVRQPFLVMMWGESFHYRRNAE